MFTVFDVETTGLNQHKDDIIQFAYVTFHRGRVVKSDVLYFYYEGMTWSEEAYNIHHIPLEFLKQHEKEFYPNLIKMFTVLGGANVGGFNNIIFDCPFAQLWLSRMGLPNLEYREVQDVMVAYRPVMHKPRFSLIALTEHMNVKPSDVKRTAKLWFKEKAGDQAHDASYDTTATAIFVLQGIAKGLIDFRDAPVTAKKNATPAPPAEKLLAMNNESKQRDPKGLLVYLGEEPYLLNSAKSTYYTGKLLPYEVNEYTNNGKLLKVQFEQESPTTWVGENNGRKHVLTIGPESDSLVISFPTKDVKAF